MTNPIEIWRGSKNPFREFNQMQRAMERFFDDWPTKGGGNGLLPAFNPTCEVTEDKLHYYFKVDLPGITKDQIRVEIQENRLTISGERKEEKKEETKKYHFSEQAYGSFSRTFNLPLAIDTEKVEAKFENGVLNVAVAKTEAATARQISVR